MALSDTIKGIVLGIFGSGKWHWVRGYSSTHDAWDIGAKTGTPVYAVAGGTVAYARDARKQADKGAAGWAMGGGNVVDINVGKNLWTQYAHLDRFVVREGQTVSKGQLIGYVGSTGGGSYSNGVYSSYGGPGSSFGAANAHLHFAVVDKNINKFIDPAKGLARIGDTSGPQAASAVDAFLKKLRELGISTDPTHVFTDAEAKKIAEQGYPDSPGMWDIIASRYRGKTVQQIMDTVGGGGTLGNDPFQNDILPDIPAAIGLFGETLASIAIYILAVVLIIAGIFLYSKSAQQGTGMPNVNIDASVI